MRNKLKQTNPFISKGDYPCKACGGTIFKGVPAMFFQDEKNGEKYFTHAADADIFINGDFCDCCKEWHKSEELTKIKKELICIECQQELN